MPYNTSLITRPNWDYADPNKAKFYNAYTSWMDGNPYGTAGLLGSGTGSTGSTIGSRNFREEFTPNIDVSGVFQHPGADPGMFEKVKNWWNKNSKGGKFFAPGTSEKFSQFTSKAMNPQFSWNSQSGLQGWGKNLGKGMTIANALYQGYNAAKGLNELSDAREATDDVVADILTSAANNSMIQYDLTSDQMNLLRQLRRGTYDTDAGLDDVDLLGALGGAVKGGVTGFLGGGVPGAVVGAVGGGANSAIDDITGGQQANTAELEALYQAVLESEQQQNAMKKQRMYALLGGY